MIKYVLYLTVSNSNISSSSYQYDVLLNPQEEDYPEQKFNPQFCQELRRELQKQTACKISQANLKKIVKTWITDIKEGERKTPMTMDLPTSIGEDLESIADQGNQELPPLITPSLSSVEPRGGVLPKLNFS